MRFIDLSNIPKYFSVANMPYYSCVKNVVGTFNSVEGIAINPDTLEESPFLIRMDINNNIILHVNNLEINI